jgi:hypothetical protein
MTIAAPPRISPALQTLIELRLDTLDRTLLGRASRQDRLNIVAEVETQIYELLAERSPDEPTREDVLAVLRQLDPPEAYVAEDAEEYLAHPHSETSRTNPRGARVTAAASPPAASLAKAAGILGMTALSLVLLTPLVYAVAIAANGGVLFLVLLMLMVGAVFIGGLLALVFGIQSRLREGWAVTGVVTGGIALLMSLVGGLLLFAELA